MALPRVRKVKKSPSQATTVAELVGTPSAGRIHDNKRRWPRWTEKIALEATTNPSGPGACWPVKLHEESPGGVGIRSKHAAEVGTLLFVRAKPPHEPNTWLCGEVVHCTPKRGGYLIGLRMDQHIPSNLPD